MKTKPKWIVLKSDEVFKKGFSRFRVDRCELPDGRVMPQYFVMEFADWVNIIPVTQDGQLVLVEQFRQGGGETFLEIPGGSTQSHGGLDEALEAGKRELIEETGYQASEWILCGVHYPNPALQSNRLHTYLALNCVKVAEPSLDPFEDLQTRLLPLKQAVKEWASGSFQHSLISASIGMALKPLKARGLISESDIFA
jgi:8-oxo-dGTP pyrophosphatase MutT (NUDIX family)